MVMDLSDYIPLTEAPRYVPGNPSYVTMWKWCRHGLTARNGEVIRLQHVRIGGRIYSKLEWIEQFIHVIAEADVAHYRVQHPNRNREIVPLPPSPSHCEADAALREAGM